MNPKPKFIMTNKNGDFSTFKIVHPDELGIEENGKKLFFMYTNEAANLESDRDEKTKVFRHEVEIDWDTMKNPDHIMDRIFAPAPWLNALPWLAIKKQMPEFNRLIFKNGFHFKPYKK